MSFELPESDAQAAPSIVSATKPTDSGVDLMRTSAECERSSGPQRVFPVARGSIKRVIADRNQADGTRTFR